MTPPTTHPRSADAHRWPDRAIAVIAARQQTMIAHAQLRACGVPASSIGTAVARGRLHPVHRSVYSLVPAGARPALAAEHAALLACGPDALLSHLTAGRLHRLESAWPHRGEVELTVVGSRRGRRRPGLAVHTTAEIAPDERTRVAGLPVTSLARTVLDLAAGRSERGVEHLVDRALRSTSRAALLRVADRHPRRPGAATIREVLAGQRPSSETWSRAEEVLLGRLRRAGVPAPETNVTVGRYRPDLLWRGFRVIGEYQSRLHHSSEHARLNDAERHNELTSWGYTVLHITRRDLQHGERMLVWIVAALVHNGWSPAMSRFGG